MDAQEEQSALGFSLWPTRSSLLFHGLSLLEMKSPASQGDKKKSQKPKLVRCREAKQSPPGKCHNADLLLHSSAHGEAV